MNYQFGTADQKRLIILAIHDAWRSLRDTVNSIRAEDAVQPGAWGEWSVCHLIHHIRLGDELLILQLQSEELITAHTFSCDPNAFNTADMGEIEVLELRKAVERFDSTHRRLRDTLDQHPAEVFAQDHPKRHLIDECAVLHYEEHTAQIAAWVDRRRGA